MRTAKGSGRNSGRCCLHISGLSGPLILSASAHMRHFGSKGYHIEIDLKPALDEKTLDKRLLSDFGAHKNSDFINALGGLLPRKLIPAVVRLSQIDPHAKVNGITEQQRAALLPTLKHFLVVVSGASGRSRRQS